MRTHRRGRPGNKNQSHPRTIVIVKLVGGLVALALILLAKANSGGGVIALEAVAR